MRKTMETVLEVVTKPRRHRHRGHGAAIIHAVVEQAVVDRLAIVYDPLTIGEWHASLNRVQTHQGEFSLSREPSQAFRRGAGGGGGGGTRQTSEGWRRSRGDEDENNEQGEEAAPANGSASWTSRGGQTRRGGSGGPMENRTKSNEKWNHTDDRPGTYPRCSCLLILVLSSCAHHRSIGELRIQPTTCWRRWMAIECRSG